MAEDALSKGPLDKMMRAALKMFKVGKSGMAVVMQKSKAGAEFRFRPVYYDPIKDTIILHHKIINDQVKKMNVPGDRLLNYLIHFGVGMAAEFRRMSSNGVCPMFNFVKPNVQRQWYKVHWTRLEKEANFLSSQIIEYTVDAYLFKAKLANPIPVMELNSRLKKMRKEDVSRFQLELERNVLLYVARSKFTLDLAPKAKKERELLSRFARGAIGPKRWFYLDRALKKVKFGHPKSYVDGYPAIVTALHPELVLEAHETNLEGLPERENLPKVWKSKKCTYFEWVMKEE